MFVVSKCNCYSGYAYFVGGIMKKFLKDKKNLTLVIMLGVALLSVVIAMLFEVFMPISCIIFGISCLYGAYLLFLVYRKKKRTRIDEFISEEESIKRKTTQFLQAEGKINMWLLILMFGLMGVLLIYYGLKVFTM